MDLTNRNARAGSAGIFVTDVLAGTQNTDRGSPPEDQDQAPARARAPAQGCVCQAPRVTDHAVVRFLERCGRINRAALVREILNPRVVAAVTDGAREYYDAWGNMTFVIDPEQREIITLWKGRRFGK